MSNSWKPARASAIAGVSLCVVIAGGCGDQAAKVVKAEKPATNNASVSSNTVVASTPEPSPAPRFTKAQVDQVKLGMTPDQVKNVLGSVTFETSSGKRTTMQWVVPEGQSIHIEFDGGKVVQKTAAGLGPNQEKLTQANLDKISTGMTEAQVFEILGPGSSESELSNGKSIVWDGNGKNVLVQIEKGKVVNKMVFKKD